MIDYSFFSGKELLSICHEAQIPISEVAVLAELSREEMDRDSILNEMRINLEVMRESIRECLHGPHCCRTYCRSQRHSACRAHSVW